MNFHLDSPLVVGNLTLVCGRLVLMLGTDPVGVNVPAPLWLLSGWPPDAPEGHPAKMLKLLCRVLRHVKDEQVKGMSVEKWLTGSLGKEFTLRFGPSWILFGYSQQSF